jgi:hypothetical protein
MFKFRKLIFGHALQRPAGPVSSCERDFCIRETGELGYQALWGTFAEIRLSWDLYHD